MDMSADESLVRAMRGVNRVSMRPAFDVNPGQNVDFSRSGLKLQSGALSITAFEVQRKLLSVSQPMQRVFGLECLKLGKINLRHFFGKDFWHGQQPIGFKLVEGHG